MLIMLTRLIKGETTNNKNSKTINLVGEPAVAVLTPPGRGIL